MVNIPYILIEFKNFNNWALKRLSSDIKKNQQIKKEFKLNSKKNFTFKIEKLNDFKIYKQSLNKI